ncbi:MAG: hypothetical protein COA92_04305 [Sulfurovum sp.]|nr:MAG: hypothetical protein COA92_04305 [Sulfurovum sp.]
MQQIKHSLVKRRNIGLVILLIIALLGYFIDRYAPFAPPGYISPEWRKPFVYFLITYKVIELGIFYLLFYRKHYIRLIEAQFDISFLEKFTKNAKRFFFLVPQGSIVFGFLSYKLSGEIVYLWLFLTIAFLTLILVNPNKLKEN